MHDKIAATHHSPFKLPGVRALLERIAVLECVQRVIPGRMTKVGGPGALRLADSGMPAGQSGRKYTILVQGTALEVFIVPVDGRLAEMEAALAAFPERVRQGNARRADEARAAAARQARLAEARERYQSRRRRGRPGQSG